ncbi:hypothetical protein PIB30_031700 [Stylosanthes scabra]|uniref:Uncharacterized protein n=1 Tax=Stylosanthes scabra TaxID=79078 RepID=A0ABU6RC33_9FABA|nr:hypothetical protein [Stylosanthes scabra]
MTPEELDALLEMDMETIIELSKDDQPRPRLQSQPLAPPLPSPHQPAWTWDKNEFFDTDMEKIMEQSSISASFGLTWDEKEFFDIDTEKIMEQFDINTDEPPQPQPQPQHRALPLHLPSPQPAWTWDENKFFDTDMENIMQLCEVDEPPQPQPPAPPQPEPACTWEKMMELFNINTDELPQPQLHLQSQPQHRTLPLSSPPPV